jgi:penicillin-binding protein-related factor A (putative recombinase)
MTPEGAVKKIIDRELLRLREAKVPLYWHKPVMNGMGAPTLDYVGSSYGRYFTIEAKKDAKTKPTAIQEKTMAAIRASGGTCFVVYDGETMRDFVLWALEGGEVVR